jgi:hypothetical protein
LRQEKTTSFHGRRRRRTPGGGGSWASPQDRESKNAINSAPAVGATRILGDTRQLEPIQHCGLVSFSFQLTDADERHAPAFEIGF